MIQQVPCPQLKRQRGKQQPSETFINSHSPIMQAFFLEIGYAQCRSGTVFARGVSAVEMVLPDRLRSQALQAGQGHSRMERMQRLLQLVGCSQMRLLGRPPERWAFASDEPWAGKQQQTDPSSSGLQNHPEPVVREARN